MSKNLDARIPPGARFTLKQQSNGSWAWSIWLWSNQLANGVNESKEAADKELKREAGKVLVKAAVGGAQRAYIRTRLKDLVRRRPYLAAFVFESWKMGLPMKEIFEAAEEQERDRHADGEGTYGWKPFKLHHLAKKPGEAALLIMNWCGELGWDEKQAYKWAASYLGVFLTNPDAAFTVEVTEKKKKRQTEDKE